MDDSSETAAALRQQLAHRRRALAALMSEPAVPGDRFANGGVGGR